jgi:hypothetical protein
MTHMPVKSARSRSNLFYRLIIIGGDNMQTPVINESPQQIQLELPDYSQAYYEWLKKQESKEEETVIVIDLY